MRDITIAKLLKTTLMLVRGRIILEGKRAIATRAADAVDRVDKAVARVMERKEERVRRLKIAPMVSIASPSSIMDIVLRGTLQRSSKL